MDFRHGDSVRGIVFADGKSMFVNGEARLPNGAKLSVAPETTLTVVMENGQMSGVPWIEVRVNGEVRSKWNVALLQGVILK